MISVPVKLGERSYEICIGTGCLSLAGTIASERGIFSRAVIVADQCVEHLHAPWVEKSLTAAGAIVETIVVKSGEQSKCIAQADRLWNKLLEFGADRKTRLVAVGGGVVGDLAGFVAASYGRGIPFMQIPTTLLAQVDSSVGGKVGVNLPGAKNMVGAFWQPTAVLIDTDTLNSLPDREYRSGLAEVVKYGMILDADFFSLLERESSSLLAKQPEVLRQVIARCCQLKAQVVEADERETSGYRAILNYGHTFGHALEAVTKYNQFLHGECVAIGMMCAARLAQRLGRIDAAMLQRQRLLLENLGLPVELPAVSHQQLVAAMFHDKKTEHGRLRFILPVKIGQVELLDGVATDDVLAVLSV
ncbi:MAG: 3-dehydroquinate synthase [Pirellulales bacterium]|nr:3-dehydroquinate synthase [Pirellulales bacterium]